MLPKNLKSPSLSHDYNGFDGIDRTLHTGGLTDIVNLRLMADKTLKMREAAVRLTSLKERPRAHYVCDGENMLILSGSQVYYLNISDLSQKEIGTVHTTEGDAQFICYDGKILLLDGDDFYVCGENNLYPINGYAPLYGKGWHPIFKGKIHQNLNLLSKRYRISYDINENNPTLFNLDVKSSRIDAAYINGRRANTAKLSISEDGMSVNCELLLTAGSVLTLYITADSYPSYHDELKSCTRAETYGDIDNRGADISSIAFCRGVNGSTVFSTRRIERSEFDEVKLEYPNSSSIYVTRSDMMTVGNGKASVTGMCRRGGKLLIFTSDNAYVMSETGENSSLIHLSSAGGCSVRDAAVPMGEYPITVSEAGILKWSPVRYDSNEYVATCISLPIGGLPHPTFYTSAVVYNFRRKNEIWFTDPSSNDSRVFIYNSLLNAWYSFSGIPADSFFDTGNKQGFFRENDIYIFDETSINDVSGILSLPIVGKIVTGKINFGSFDRRKRLYRLAFRISSYGSLNTYVTDASNRSVNFLSSDTSGEQSGYIEQRVSVSRSRYYTVTAANTPGKGITLSGMSLSAVN